VTIQTIIKNSIKKLRDNNETLTPQNYEKAFCEEAKKHGVIVQECNKVDKFIQKLAPKYQKELYNRNIQTLDEMFVFLTTLLNRLDKEESAAVIKAYTLLIRRIIQAATLYKDNELQSIADFSLKKLDPHMKLNEIEELRLKWNDFLMKYDDSFLQPLQNYIPVQKMDYKQICNKLLECLQGTPKAKEIFDALAQVLVASLSPSIASSSNDSIASISQQILKNPDSLSTKAMIDDIKSMVKLRISLDKAEITMQVEKLNDIIETLSAKLYLMGKNSSKSSSRIEGIKAELESVDVKDQNFKQVHQKLSLIANSLEEEIKLFYNDTSRKKRKRCTI